MTTKEQVQTQVLFEEDNQKSKGVEQPQRWMQMSVAVAEDAVGDVGFFQAGDLLGGEFELEGVEGVFEL
jgi:hypothetical protein